MILKAGTYRFNDVLTDVDIDKTITLKFEFYITPIGDIVIFDTISFTTIEAGSLMVYKNSVNSQQLFAAYQAGSWSDLEGYSTQTITITKDTEVDDIFGAWYILNTNYNEVNAKPLAEITYNGETIAQLNAGETAVLSCAEKRMITDVSVKIGEIPEPNLEAVTVEALPEAQIVKPSGSVEGFSQVNVKAKSPLPIEVVNATLMAAYLESAEVGAIYKYTGTTDDTYENGSTYTVVEENGTKVYKKLVNDIGLGKVEHWRFKDVQTFIGETDDYYGQEGDNLCEVYLKGNFIVNGFYCNQFFFEAFRYLDENGSCFRRIQANIRVRDNGTDRTISENIYYETLDDDFINRVLTIKDEYMNFYIFKTEDYPLTIDTSSLIGFTEMGVEEWLLKVADKIS